MDYGLMILLYPRGLHFSPRFFPYFAYSTIVADEVHLIHDAGRGPTLETIMARFKQLGKQIIALSATIRSSEQIAEWLGAKRIKSKFRPVPLKRGVSVRGENIFEDGSKGGVDGESINDLVKDTISGGGQTLIFVNTRRSTEALARKLSIGTLISPQERKKLATLAKSAMRVATPRSVKEKVAKCISKGIVYHHAGLPNSLRTLTEQNFRAGTIKCIVATPTLAFGVNLPAKRVVIRDAWRYDPNYGRTPTLLLYWDLAI